MDIPASTQMVITTAIGQRLDLQTQLLRQTEFGWPSWRSQPAQFVHHHRRRDHAALQRQLTSYLQRLQAHLASDQQQFNKGPVTLGLLEHTIPYQLNRHRQLPLDKRRPVTHRPRLLLQYRQVMPGITDLSARV